MKILQINKFFYLKGGSERYMLNVSDLLRSKGHSVAYFSMEDQRNIDSEWSSWFVSNVDYNKKHSFSEQIKLSVNTLYSTEASKKISALADSYKPDIVHIHNFNHQLTPSILFALRKKDIPVVMTVHDYKLACPSYSMLNHGRVCELCAGQKFYHAVRTRCHKDSFSKSLLVAMESYLHHQVLNSYRNVHSFICPSFFISDKIKGMGLNGNFVHLRHFVDLKRLEPVEGPRGNKLVYFGRLSREKGIFALVDAVKVLPVDLEIIGDGPLKNDIEKKVKRENIKNVKMSGYLEEEALFGRIRESCAAVVPSEWYENNPLSILEAFALGVPVIGARIGGIPEIVRDGETGLLFEPGDAEDLRDKIEKLLSDPEKSVEMGKNARDLMEKEYNAETHYEKLMEIYSKAIA